MRHPHAFTPCFFPWFLYGLDNPRSPRNPLSPHNPTFRRPGGRSKISATKVKSCCAVMVGSTSSSLTSPDTRRTCSFIQLLRLPAWLWCHRPTKAVSKGLWYREPPSIQWVKNQNPGKNGLGKPLKEKQTFEFVGDEELSHIIHGILLTCMTYIGKQGIVV